MKKTIGIIVFLLMGVFFCALGWLMCQMPAPREIGIGLTVLSGLILCGGVGLGGSLIYPWNGLSNVGKTFFVIVACALVGMFIYLLYFFAPDLK
jgi:hypothetical protein